MPFGEDIYKNDGTIYEPNTPAAYGVVECKKMLARRAEDKNIPLPKGFKADVLTFGSQAEKLCASIQAAYGLKSDGQCGPTTMFAGFKLDLQPIAQAAGLEFETIAKLVMLESRFNPSAYNPAPYPSVYPNGTRDRGPTQINTASGIEDAKAFDALFAFDYSCDRLAQALQHFDNQLDVAIASYNVGNGGAFYYQKGRDYWNLYQKQEV